MAPQARIEINSVPGSNDDLPINTLVQLSNQDLGGELTYTWAILDQPPGTADVLSSTSLENPTLTPKKEGTYLLQLIVNFGLPDEQIDRAIVGIRQLKTRERIPAAGETNENDTARGWASAVNALYQRIDALLSDPGIIIGANTSGSTLTRGDVVRVTSGQVIKGGLPGQETVPGFVKAPATTLSDLDELLCVVEGDVLGNPGVSAGALTKVRYIGRLASLSLGSGAVGDPVYVSDTATISTTVGTYRRQIGSIMSVSGGLRDIWFDGVGGADIVPADRAFLLYGPPASGMLNAHRVDGNNATPGATGGVPYMFRAGDNPTVALVAKRFGAGGNDIFQIRDEFNVVLARFNVLGNLDMSNAKIHRAVFQALNATSAPLNARRFNAGATANLFEVQDETGTAMSLFDKSGNLDMFLKDVYRSVIRSQSDVTVAAIIKRWSGTQTANLTQWQDETGSVLARMLANGTLQMSAAPIDMASHLINNVTDPAAAQDAATRNYVDLLAASRSAVNYLTNSAFAFVGWGGNVVSAALTTTRTFSLFDRWAAWQTAAGPTGAIGNAGPIWDLSNYAYLRIGAGGPATLWTTQEIDRAGDVPVLAGKPMTLTFRARNSGTANAPTQITVRVVSSTNAADPAAQPTYATGHQVDATGTFTLTSAFQTFTLAVPALRSTTACLAVQITANFSAAAGAGDFVGFNRFMFTEGTVAVPWAPRGGSLASDYHACCQWMQKGWDMANAVGASTATGCYETAIQNTLITNGLKLPIHHVNFPVRFPGTPVIAVYSPTAVAGSIDVSGTARTVSVSSSYDHGFVLSSTSAVAYTPASPYIARLHWVAYREYA